MMRRAKITESEILSLSFDEGSNKTTLVLPYIPATAPLLATRATSETTQVAGDEKLLEPVAGSPSSFTCQGDLRGQSFFIGLPYRSSYVFSTFAMRGDSKGNAITSGRLQLRSLMLNCADTGYLQVKVEPDFRNPSIHTFTGRQLGHGSNLLGTIPLYTGVVKCPILAENTQARISLESSSFLPFSVVSAGWEGFYNTRDRRQM